MLREDPHAGSDPFSLLSLKEIGRCIVIVAFLRRLLPVII
jgi:hypothetical protein